ncbi:MAG: DUF2141 domain-containing protein [Tannerella sp.]|jgi:uncharacterized protein (DUF2141 family)|nr:DUF2141 domain-containing protein [Tannerella sp.]
MKTKLFLLMALAAGTLSAQNKLTVVVDGIESVKGHLMVGLYDKEGFMKKPVRGGMVKVSADTLTIVFENIPSGEYAISLYQDENDNRKLDMGLFGPKEKWGFSNNAKGKMGPPTYENCKFKVEEDTEINITL